MKDNLTTCDRCGSDACYVQEVNEKIKKTICVMVVVLLLTH
tara:strand:+ start:155 stop:277 length:123 start_codon:yes stop_codon:yes gene_type:complete